jgi:hypothetical protein
MREMDSPAFQNLLRTGAGAVQLSIRIMLLQLKATINSPRGRNHQLLCLNSLVELTFGDDHDRGGGGTDEEEDEKEDESGDIREQFCEGMVDTLILLLLNYDARRDFKMTDWVGQNRMVEVNKEMYGKQNLLRLLWDICEVIPEKAVEAFAAYPAEAVGCLRSLLCCGDDKVADCAEGRQALVDLVQALHLLNTIRVCKRFARRAEAR